jgi:hypothetical protein
MAKAKKMGLGVVMLLPIASDDEVANVNFLLLVTT